MTAIVLAGQRDGDNELARHAGASCKAFVEIAGQPMLSRVLDTLASSSTVGDIVLSGPDEATLRDQDAIGDRLRSGEVAWLQPQASPSDSAYKALCTIGPDKRVLLTTADHPLLNTEIVEEFCRQSALSGADVVVGWAPYSLVQDEFPAMKKTVLRFRNAELCGCNLFAFLTPEGRKAAEFWQRLESQRKKPLQIVRFLGWWAVAKYVAGTLTHEDALQAFSIRLGLKIRAAILPFAEAAVDVDSVADYLLVQERVRKSLTV